MLFFYHTVCTLTCTHDLGLAMLKGRTIDFPSIEN